MKSFLISLGLLTFFVLVTTVNCFKVGNILNHVYDNLSELPHSENNYISPDAHKNANKIYSYWRSKRDFLNLTINTAELRDCEIALAELTDFSESDTGADYNAALAEAKIRISVLIDREKFSFGNIL